MKLVVFKGFVFDRNVVVDISVVVYAVIVVDVVDVVVVDVIFIDSDAEFSFDGISSVSRVSI